MENRNDFDLRKFYVYNGPNYYLNSKALVFNIFLEPEGPEVSYYKDEVLSLFPAITDKNPSTVIDLYANVVMEILKMDINLYLNNYSITEDEDEYVVAVEFFDDRIAEDAAYLAADWFKAMNEKATFDIKTEYAKLQVAFDKSILGGPTIYSLVEAGLKRNIPVFFLFEENQFQWGYGKKQLRGRSTTFHTDGIKDTEFTMFKDMCGDFLIMCGFPTPIGKNCFDVEDAVEEANILGFPVVVKPVSGHKGQGVTTGIESEEEVRKAFQKILDMVENDGAKFDGIIVQQQIYGTDHRLLSVNGKFAAALQRVPAYVDGNGNDTIEQLIKIENDLEVRLDNARSPLCKIKIDQDMHDFLTIQELTISSVPAEGERIFLRRVANISAGGVSINVTDNIHPKNIEMVESISKFFNVKCLGIDVLSADISKPWNEGNFGIIEINAGPGVFMHLAPAIGASIDVPGIIMESHFKTPLNSRIPIIAGNNITQKLSEFIYQKLQMLNPDIEYGSLTELGVHFNNAFFFNNECHDQNVKIILRNPKLDFAVFNHNKFNIYDYGFFHEGADMVILEKANYTEDSMKTLLLENGTLVEISENQIDVKVNGEITQSLSFLTEEEKGKMLEGILEPVLEKLIHKYSFN